MLRGVSSFSEKKVSKVNVTRGWVSPLSPHPVTMTGWWFTRIEHGVDNDMTWAGDDLRLEPLTNFADDWCILCLSII